MVRSRRATARSSVSAKFIEADAPVADSPLNIAPACGSPHVVALRLRHPAAAGPALSWSGRPPRARGCGRTARPAADRRSIVMTPMLPAGNFAAWSRVRTASLGRPRHRRSRGRHAAPGPFPRPLAPRRGRPSSPLRPRTRSSPRGAVAHRLAAEHTLVYLTGDPRDGGPTPRPGSPRWAFPRDACACAETATDDPSDGESGRAASTGRRGTRRHGGRRRPPGGAAVRAAGFPVLQADWMTDQPSCSRRRRSTARPEAQASVATAARTVAGNALRGGTSGADGTTWRRAASRACSLEVPGRAAPGPFVRPQDRGRARHRPGAPPRGSPRPSPPP